jgi:hypothetical protein
MKAMLEELEVRAVIFHELVAVAYCVAADGREVAVAVEPGMAHDLSTALTNGQRPLVEVEAEHAWQIIGG